MSTSPIYSNVSLTKFERVFTALKNEADPYAAAGEGKNPLLSFFNEGTKKLFNYDYYAGQDAAADEFTASVVDAWRQLAYDDSGEKVFQIEDAFGNQRTVALHKKQDGSMDLVEKNTDSTSVVGALVFGAMQTYGVPVIGLHRGELTSSTKDKVFAKVGADNVAVATAVIDTAVKYVKEQFQSVSPVYDASLALIANNKFQLRIAHEVLASANDKDPVIASGALNHIIANGAQSDIVKAVDVLKEMVAHANKDKKEVIKHCVLVLINASPIDDDLVKSMVGHMAPEVLASVNENDPDIVAAVLKHIIASGVKADIVKAVSVLKDMVANAGSYKKEVIQRCALVLINERSIENDLVKSMVGHIVANAAKYDNEIVQDCALFIVRHDKHNPFSKDIALAAVDVLANAPEHLRGAPLVRMARIIIRHNHDFFSKPTKGQESQEKIAAFYESKGGMDALLGYSEGLLAVLDAQQKISVKWTYSGREFVMGEVERGEKGPKPFYTENKVQRSDSPHKQLLTLRALWIQEGDEEGDFEAAIRANHDLARLIVKERNHDAIKIWNDRHQDSVTNLEPGASLF